MKVPFSKLSGCGNDFILIDNCDQFLSVPSSSWLTALCHRHDGIGADGVIWLENNTKDVACIRLYNSDGSEAASCGNAFRCLLAYLKNRSVTAIDYKIETPFTSVKANWEQDLIRIELQDPSDLQWNIPLQLENRTVSCHLLNTGVPHIVTFTDELETTDFAQLGKSLRHHPQLAPHGANVNLVTLQSDHVRFRTYERGVEAETLACGTGAVAVALACSRVHGLNSPISVTTRSGETLQVDFSLTSLHQFHHVSLLGPAKLVYEGHIELGQVPHGCKN